MPEKVDHRRATALRNAAAILDATERLLANGSTLSMAAIASETGVSRPTLYAHYRTIGEVVEAAVERAVLESMAAFEAARPDAGPADAALERMLATSWDQLARFQSVARGALEHLTPAAVHRAHEAMMRPLHALVDRGRRDGVFRTDVPAAWLVSMYFSLVHGAEEHAGSTGVPREQVRKLLLTTARDVFLSPRREG
jgi:TetR/AcrR family transcriptional regulator, mexCD-oprJ operon repressor